MKSFDVLSQKKSSILPPEVNKCFVNDKTLHEFVITNYTNITLPWIFSRSLEGSAIPKPSPTFDFVEKGQQTTEINIHETSIIPLVESSKDTSENNEPIELVLEDTDIDNTILEPMHFERMGTNFMHVSHSSDEDETDMINSSEPNEEEVENINLIIRFYGSYNSILYEFLDERLFRSKSFIFPLIPVPASDPSSIYTALNRSQMILAWVMGG